MSTNDAEFRSFEEFWPFYLREHSKKANRALHFAGTTAAMAILAASAVARRPAWLLAAPVVGYGLSWVGHFFIEQNRPATFRYPAWSFRGDLRMWAMTVQGTLDAELERVTSSNGVHAEAGENGEGQAPVSYQGAADPGTMN